MQLMSLSLRKSFPRELRSLLRERSFKWVAFAITISYSSNASRIALQNLENTRFSLEKYSSLFSIREKRIISLEIIYTLEEFPKYLLRK